MSTCRIRSAQWVGEAGGSDLYIHAYIRTHTHAHTHTYTEMYKFTYTYT